MKHLLLLLGVLVIATIACQMPVRGTFPQQPENAVVSGDASTQMEDQLATAAAQLQQSGSVTLILTETQLTSYLADQLAAQPEAPITDAQVRLYDGLMEITGQTTLGILTTSVRLVFEPFTEQGNLRVSIQEAQMGSIPLPESTLNNLAEVINQSLDGLVTLNNQNIYIDSLSITDGSITLTGQLQ